MDHNHVQMSNHLPHDTQHHHHSDMLQDESIISTHNHLHTSDHDSMMKMYFHTGFIETILFEPWLTTSIPLFICSWIFVFILGILYEGIRKIRQYLEEERLIKKPLLDEGNENELERMNTELPELPNDIKKKIPLRPIERILHSILYTVHLSLSYILMLIAMTFNVYLFLAIIFGISTGYVLFIWNRIIPSTSKNQSRTREKVFIHNNDSQFFESINRPHGFDFINDKKVMSS